MSSIGANVGHSIVFLYAISKTIASSLDHSVGVIDKGKHTRLRCCAGK